MKIKGKIDQEFEDIQNKIEIMKSLKQELKKAGVQGGAILSGLIE